jgi:hypothetical protein
MSEIENRIAAGTQAKLYTSSARRKSSVPISANPQINKLINNIAKGTSYAYSSAVARAKLSPLDELQRRVFKKLRPRYSSDRFTQLMAAVSKMPPLARHDWLIEEERRLNELR